MSFFDVDYYMLLPWEQRPGDLPKLTPVPAHIRRYDSFPSPYIVITVPRKPPPLFAPADYQDIVIPTVTLKRNEFEFDWYGETFARGVDVYAEDPMPQELFERLKAHLLLLRAPRLIPLLRRRNKG